jgi:hypothetical protein
LEPNDYKALEKKAEKANLSISAFSQKVILAVLKSLKDPPKEWVPKTRKYKPKG